LSEVLEHGDPDRQPRRWLTRRLATIVVIGVLLSGGGLALARWASTGGDAPPIFSPLVSLTPPPSTEAGSTTDTHVIASVPIAGGDQVQLALVPGGAWLSSWTKGTLTRLSMGRKPQVTSQVRIGTPDESVLSMAYGARSLWVVDSATNSVVSLDPATGQRQAHRQFGGCGVADTVAFGANSLWVACSGQIGKAGARERILRVDPATLQVRNTTSLPGEGENLVVVANGTDVWAGGATPLTHVFPGSRTAAARYRADTLPLAVNGHTLWAGSPNGLAALDARTGHVLATIDLPGPPPALAVDPSGRAWTLSPSIHLGMLRPTGFLYRFAQYAGRVDVLAVDDEALWVYSGTRIIVFDISRMRIN
jgi:hypothetical protein